MCDILKAKSEIRNSG